MPPKKAKAPTKKDDKKSKSKPEIRKTARPTTLITKPSYTIEPEVSVRFSGLQFENPWEEWDDQELNGEEWEPEASMKSNTRDKKGKKDRMEKKDKIQSKESKEESSPKPPVLYHDSDIVQLPESLREQIVEWRRPAELYNEDELILYDDSAPAYSDLTTANKHIVQSEFMREFMCAICLLQYLGVQDIFPVEAITASYAPSTEGLPWQPWHHIYSLCKAGKGQDHRPLLNTTGKYVVRLYFIGRWRRFYVDDLLPVDISETSLLPRTALVAPDTMQPAKRELWPALLCKALLKIAALSWTSDSELKDFSIFYCLTGWHATEIIVEDMSNERLWKNLQKYCGELKIDEDLDANNTASEEADKTVKKKPKKGAKKEADNSSQKNRYVCALLKDLREISEGVLPEIAPCFSHYVLIRKIRNIVLKAEDNKELSNWQYFRWIPWAFRHNIYNPFPATSIRVMMITSFMKRCSEHALNLIKAEPRKIDTSPASEKSDKIEKTKKGEKKSILKEKGKKGKGKSISLPLDPSVWLNLEEITDHISKIIIFQRPSTYQYNIKMTGSVSKTSTAVGAKEPKTAAKDKKKNDKGKGAKTSSLKTENASQLGHNDIVWPNSLASCRNVPAYLFIDSLEPVSLIISFSHLNSKALGTIECAGSIIEEENESLKELSLIKMEEETTPSVGHIILEKYDWIIVRHVAPRITISTLGIKTEEFEFLPGRQVFQIWIKSNSAYSLHIMSNREIFVASLEKISELMSYEVWRFTQMSFDMSDAFYDLLYSLGTKTYLTAIRAFYNSCKFDRVDQIMEDHEHIPDKIYDMIFNQILELLKNTEPGELQMQNYTRSLRILFLDPDIGVQKLIQIEYNSEDEGLEGESSVEMPTPTISKESNYFPFECDEAFNDVTFQRKMYNSAVCIQNFFKLIYLKKLKSYHTPNHPKYRELFDDLWNIFQEIFADSKREITVPKLFRSLFAQSELMKQSYRLYDDLEFTLRYDMSKGTVNTLECDKWTELVSITLFCHSQIEIKYHLQFYCPLEIFFVRIFNNDNGNEIKSNVVALQQNAYGYAVLVFGLNTTPKVMQDIPWKFHAYRLPSAPSIHICDNLLPECNQVQVSQVIGKMVRNNYIPNVRDIVAKCQIKIQHNLVTSLSWSSSYEEAKFMIRLYNSNGITLAKIIGRGNIVIPLIFLEYKPQSNKKHRGDNSSRCDDEEEVIWEEETEEQAFENIDDGTIVKRLSSHSKREVPLDIFTVEVKILEKTWPLLPEEWDITEEAKRRRYIKTTFVRMTDIETTDHSSASFDKTSSEIYIADYAPWWEMRIFIEAGDTAILQEDICKQKEIQYVKRRWESEEPGRLDRGEKLRKHYYECVKRNLLYCLPEEIDFEESNLSEVEYEEEEHECLIATDVDDLSSSELIPDLDLVNPPIRSTKNPYKEKILNMIPPLPVGLYSQHARLYTYEEAETMKYTRLIAESDFRFENLVYENKIHEMMKQRFRRNGLMLKHHSDIIAKAKEAEELVYAQRDEYLNSVMAKQKQKQLEEAMLLKQKLAEEKAAKKAAKENDKRKKGVETAKKKKK